jgi:nucleoside 2-deoxyribosyltransferase
MNNEALRVYVASRFKNYEAVRDFAEHCRAEGFVVTYDWTLTDAFDENGVVIDPKGVPDNPKRARYFSELDLRGVRTADALVLLGQPDMKGAWVETGAALALGIPVIAVEPLPACIFTSLAILAADLDQAMDTLRSMAHGIA